MLSKTRLIFIFLLFFVSGISGLVYEVVWIRLAILIFGSTTNSVVAVISSFLTGLALGSVIGGYIADKLKSSSLIKAYSQIEIGVGLYGLVSFFAFQLVTGIYKNFSDGSYVTSELLAIKFFLITIIILIPTLLMGTTLPILVKAITPRIKSLSRTLSYLYAINTLGAAVGVILAGFLLIEIYGLKLTLAIAASLNCVVGLFARKLINPQSVIQSSKSATDIHSSRMSPVSLIAFFVSGLVSISLQVIWVRVMTPTMGTVTYAFSSILFVYLLGLGLGSLIYKNLINVLKSDKLLFGITQVGIAASVLASVILLHKYALPPIAELITRVFLPTIFMGLTFPSILGSISSTKSDQATQVGLFYLINTFGAVVGSYLVSFVLFNRFGSNLSLILLTMIGLLNAAPFLVSLSIKPLFRNSAILVWIIIFSAQTFLLVSKPGRLLPYKQDFLLLDAKFKNIPYTYIEDEIASVFALKQTSTNEPRLVIDGVDTTHRVSLTRFMAHLPINLHSNPHKVLIIALGMGTTYRSSLKNNIETHAVELVPTVPRLMDYFQPDANIYLNHPKGKIIVNDGRNFASLTRDKYDIIIIDPPPPFNTAGSTILHSSEYYRDLKKILNPGGIVNQWIYSYGSREDDISMAVNTHIQEFPYVLAVQKTDSPGGIFLLGSLSPIDSSKIQAIMQNPIVQADLQEVSDKEFIGKEPLEIIGDRKSLEKVVGNYPVITDTHPRTEYYLLRHRFSRSPVLVNEGLDAFISKLKSEYKPIP